MFSNTLSFNQPLIWNVSKVENMSYMFLCAEDFNQSLNHWIVSKVNDMEGMFALASSFNESINKWNVSNVKIMNSIFDNSESFHLKNALWYNN